MGALGSLIVGVVLGTAFGSVVVWLAMRTRLHIRGAQLDAEQKATQEKIALLAEARTDLESAFQALAGQALHANSEAFVSLAGAKVLPLETALNTINTTIRELEAKRNTATGALGVQLDMLKTETRVLSKALSTPDTVGNWGQMQLRRVVELAGMLKHCDFSEQTSITTEEGNRQRPDLIVNLPGGATVVVDAKVPRSAYLEAAKTDDDAERAKLLKSHAVQVRKHMTDLGGKKYWEQFAAAPECVVMFVPHEPFISAACDADANLIEDGFANDKVMIATPLTLIALLLGFANGWRQVQVQENADRISTLGRELYKRLGSVADHLHELGKHLTGSGKAYDAVIGSLEARVLPTAREFPRLLATGEAEIAPLEPIDLHLRSLQAPELTGASGENGDAGQDQAT